MYFYFLLLSTYLALHMHYHMIDKISKIIVFKNLFYLVLHNEAIAMTLYFFLTSRCIFNSEIPPPVTREILPSTFWFDDVISWFDDDFLVLRTENMKTVATEFIFASILEIWIAYRWLFVVCFQPSSSSSLPPFCSEARRCSVCYLVVRTVFRK